MIVPETFMQEHFKKDIVGPYVEGSYIQNIKKATDAYLGWIDKHAKQQRIFGGRFMHLYHGRSGGE